MGTSWDARTYDRSSQPQQAWVAEVLVRLQGVAPDATILDVGCGTGRVTEALLALVPRGRVLAVDASAEMAELAFVRTSILPAHLPRLPPERREPFAAAVVSSVHLPLDYVRLNASAVRNSSAVRANVENGPADPTHR